MLGNFDVTTLAIGICGMGAIVSFTDRSMKVGLMNVGLCLLNIIILLGRN